jgi:hypothetical protein
VAAEWALERAFEFSETMNDDFNFIRGPAFGRGAGGLNGSRRLSVVEVEPRIDKRALVEAVKERLTAELARSTGQALDAAAGATHVENSAEGDKDMRATEASYVARGHAERVQALKESLVKLGAMPLREFLKGDLISGSAIVDIQNGERIRRYFLVPVAGGERIEPEGVEVSTLATTSPLGFALLGLREGDDVEVATPSGARVYEVLRVR